MERINLRTARLLCAKVLALALVFILVFTDLSTLFRYQNFPHVPKAHALTGDYAIFKETTGTTQVTTSALDVTWDTKTVENPNITLGVDNSSINLSEGGKYLVLYNVWTEKGTGSGSDRRSFETNLTLDGGALEYGRAAGYFRDATGEDEAAYAAGGAIINSSAGQDLGIQIKRDDTNSSAESLIRGGTNGVSVLKLNDDFDYLRLHQGTRSSDISGNTSFTDVAFDTADEVDTGSFGFTASPTAGDITLKGSAGDKFLLFTNVRLENDSGSSNRQNYETRLTIDGAEIPGTRTTGYLRGTAGTNFTTISYQGIVEKHTNGDEILNLELRRESVTGVSTDIVANETALSAVALPSSADYIRLTSTSSSQTLATTRTPFNWNEQLELSGSSFSHSTSTNNSRITFDASGNYLFFSTAYTERSSDSDRNVPRIEWRLDGSTVLDYGGHGSFNRGDQGTDDAFTSGSSGGILLNAITSTQYLELLQSDETGDSPNAAFTPGRIAIQGVDLASLSQIDSNVSLESNQKATTSPNITDFETGSTFVVTENTSSRNITNMVLTESGTIDAANDISNVDLFYDIDTTSPYDCVSETYDGNESQFGSTDTDGFTAANGTVSFTDSVSISTTQSFCGYVVFDIESGAVDTETVNININDPASDVVTTGGGAVGPASAIGDNTETTIADPEITLAHYHWRNDDGSEVGATSATGGSEDTPALSFSTSTPQRLRMSVYAPGTGRSTMNFHLEYAQKSGTCASANGWTSVGATGAAWDMFDSGNITNGSDTTNIAVSAGGVSDPATVFESPNGALLDTTATSGPITVTYGELEAIGEYGTVTNTNGSTSTVNLIHTYTNPVVVASVRYNRTTDAFRTARITKKTNTSFDVLTDDEGGDATGSTAVDYLVVEAGTWNIDDETGTRQVIATTTEDISTVAGGGSYGSISGTQRSWESSFSSDPAVIATVSSYNSTDWMMAHVSDGTTGTTPPDNFNFGVYIGRSYGAVNVYNENIDVVAFETGHGTNNKTEYDAVVGPDGVVTHIPAAVDFSDTFNVAPVVTLVMQGAEQGGNGATALRHTGVSVNTANVTVALDEDGDSGGDRNHTDEPISVLSFEGSSGSLYTSNIVDQNYAELEFSVQATASSSEGVGYCFRLTDGGVPLRNYDVYPEATLNSDVTVSATGTQAAGVNINSSNNYLGGAFVISDNVASRTVESITITETGSIDGSTGLSNIELYYEHDTSSPYNCASESYSGAELQYGSTDSDGFSGTNGSSTFTGSVAISTTSSMCIYAVYDVTVSPSDGDLIDFDIFDPSSDVVISEGSVGPGSTAAISGSTTVNAPNLTQTSYHWRNDDGDETDGGGGATSATGGAENTPVVDVQQHSIRRLRLAVSNEGNSVSSPTQYRLEYGTKVSSCALVSNWQDVDVGAAFVMASTSNLIENNDTSNIASTSGGISDPNLAFESPNGGQKEDNSQTGPITLSGNEFAELEFAVRPTDQSAFDSTYCFRVTDAGTPIASYDTYPELTTLEKLDFFVQRGVTTLSSTSTTLTAGVDYDAPSATSSAFVRITNTQLTGAGEDTDDDENNTADGVTAYVEDQNDITSNFTLARPSDTANSINTRVNWEIVEYIGISGADNEMVVRDVGTVTYGGTAFNATGTSVAQVTDDSDVVVFITGQFNPDAGTVNYNDGLSTAAWNSTSSVPVFTRGDADSIAARASYAVVEYTGTNWSVQRVEHTYTGANQTETEEIMAVGSLSRTFLHAQKRVENAPTTSENGLHDFGHQVWLSSIGSVSFFLQGPSDPVSAPPQHHSVAWIIENAQTGTGAMNVYRSSGQLSNDETTEPRADTLSIGGTLDNTSNASIFVTNESTGSGQAFPRPIIAPRIINTTQYELWRSDTGQFQTYRTEVVEWPVAELSIRQNYYRLYVDNDSVEPIDPWPTGPTDLGENSAMTDLDEPLGTGERVRLRMTLFVNNSTLVQESQSFKLQYARRDTTCSAIATWNDLGAPDSGEIWRGYNGSPIDGDPVSTTSLRISVSDQAGTYEEGNDSELNPYTVNIGEDLEYDWVIENNGALQKSSYCFRMIEAGGSSLDGYDNYPTVRTSGYTPVSVNWRWYGDEQNETPTTSLAAENVAPTDIGIEDVLKLRIRADEIEGAAGANIKFDLEYSEYSDFRDGGTTLTSTSTCTGGKIWCYADGIDNDDDVISTTTLSGTDLCLAGSGDGCGLHNEASGLSSPFTHSAFAKTEHEFTLKHDGARVNTVYYFRLVDATNGSPVSASTSYPSLVTEGASMTFEMSGIASSTTIEGVTTDVNTTPSTISFGTLPINTQLEAAHRIVVDTNGTEGYQLLMYGSSDLQNAYGNSISAVTGTNDSPTSWAVGCPPSASGCFGYHSGDDLLEDGSTRFAANDTYAGLSSTTPMEVGYNSAPANSEVTDIIYKIEARELQAAGEYETGITYIAIPVF